MSHSPFSSFFKFLFLPPLRCSYTGPPSRPPSAVQSLSYYSLLLLCSSFTCRHNENWQDTLLSTILLPPFVVLSSYPSPPPQHPSPPFHHSSFQQWIHFFIMLLFSPLLWISLILSCFNLFSFLCAASLPFRTTACTSLLMNELLLSCFSLATKTEDYKPFLTLFCLRHVEKCFCRGKHSRIVTDELKLRKMETKKRRCKGGIAGDKIFKHSKTPSEWVKVAL